MKHDTFLHGADYNPDQWHMKPEIVEEDIAAMKLAGVTTVTVGIFTWTLYEPEEGLYTFAWLDALLDRLHQEGISVFLCTPSGSKPMWMSEKYPEIRRIDREGRRERSGHRHNHCPSSTLYRQKVAALNEQMAKHYAGHPSIKLWHVSNELQGECFCPNCLNRFRDWLKDRYQTLDALNQAWWARFWNHSFTDWREIDPRDGSIDGMQVDWKRFVNAVNWKPVNKLKPNGIHLMECAQMVAHGADAVLYFQFRKGRGGGEKYHGAILDHDSRTDHRVFREVASAGKWLGRHAAVAGSLCPRAEVAILHDWESQWALNTSGGIRQPPTTPKDPRDAYHDLLNEHHRGWWQAGVPTDVIWPDAKDFREQLAGRRVILAPAQHMLKDGHAEALLDAVNAGARLVLSHLSGIVNENNQCLLGGWPGNGLHSAAGAKVTEWDSLFDGETRAVEASGMMTGSYKIERAFGLLKPEGATPFAVLREGLDALPPAGHRSPAGRTRHPARKRWTKTHLPDQLQF